MEEEFKIKITMVNGRVHDLPRGKWQVFSEEDPIEVYSFKAFDKFKGFEGKELKLSLNRHQVESIDYQ